MHIHMSLKVNTFTKSIYICKVCNNQAIGARF